MGTPSKERTSVKRILDASVAGKTDFGDARDPLHALPPEVMRDVLALAGSAHQRGRGLLVMVLSDVLYAPAQMVGRANKAAGWSNAHGRYRDPAAKAAANVAQGVWYAVSSLRANRLQAMHHARDAIEYAGGRLPVVRAELDWQLARVRAAVA